MNVDKMRRQLERNEDAYQLQYLAQHPQAPQFPSLQRLAAAIYAMQFQPVTLSTTCRGRNLR